jgi:hypothetical protein
MNPQTILRDEVVFIGSDGLDARGFFYKVIIVKTLAPLIEILRGKKSAKNSEGIRAQRIDNG